MKIKYLKSILISIIFVALSCSTNNLDSKELLLTASEKLNAYKHIEYEIGYKIKLFDAKDTLSYTKSSVIYQKQPADTILGYYSNISNPFESRIYDGNNFYLIVPERKQIIKDAPKINGSKYTINNAKKELIPFFLRRENAFKNYVNDAKSIVLIDSIVNNTKVWKLTIDLPPVDDLTSIKREIYLRKKDLFPIGFKKYTTLLNIQTEYVEIFFDNINVVSTPKSSFSSYYEVPENYSLEIYQPTSKVNNNPLNIGSDAPSIVGKTLNGDIINPKDIYDNNEVILIDFWYLACPPCIKSIPKLQEIYKKYKEKGLVVYGVNPIDKDKTNELIAFKDKLKMDYPILLTDMSIAQQFKIYSYPTLYIIKNQKIEYVHIGFTENFSKEVEAVIQRLLKK